MLALWRELRDDRFARAGRRELALLERIAVDADVVGDIQPVLEDAHFGAFDIAEWRRQLGLAIAVGIAQRRQAVATGEIDIAVGGDVQVACRTPALVDHHGGETRGQRQTIVGRDSRGGEKWQQADTNYSSEARSAHVPFLKIRLFGRRQRGPFPAVK